MRLDHEFTVPVSAAQAWPILLDIDRIAPCMPGATITKVDGDDFEGTVKVKVGPITVTYGGTASFIEKDESQRIAVLEARGRETRGSGTATATVTAQIFDEGESSARVAVSTDLSITGKPAQFGRGVMNDVGGKLLGRFADCLAGQLAGGTQDAPAAAPADAAPASAQAGVPAQSQLNGSEPANTPVTAASAAGAARWHRDDRRRRRDRARRHGAGCERAGHAPGAGGRGDVGAGLRPGRAPPRGRAHRPHGGRRRGRGQAPRPRARRRRRDRGDHRGPSPPAQLAVPTPGDRRAVPGDGESSVTRVTSLSSGCRSAGRPG